MKNFKDYMLLAINRQGLRGNNALAREIGINSAAMSALYTGKSLPAESTMIKLAELAGLPKEEALIDLNLWRSAAQPEIQTVWIRLAKMISMLCFVTYFSLNPKPTKANKELSFDNSTFKVCTIDFKHYATFLAFIKSFVLWLFCIKRKAVQHG